MRRIQRHRMALIIGVIVGIVWGSIASWYLVWDDRIAAAQQTYTVTVDVLFVASEEREPAGTPCGLSRPLTTEHWPLAEQLVVTSANSVVVGAIDLADPFDLEIGSQAALPGMTDDRGLCRLSRTLDLTPSFSYTFTVEGRYTWTISADDLRDRDWAMDVVFLS